jgi:sulfite exporter TauE/SafE
MEFAVGLMLVFLGFVNLRSFGEAAGRASHIYMTQWEKDGADIEPRTHDVATALVDLMDHRFGASGAYRWARPLVVGLVHGLAGSAAVALLVLTTLHDSRWAVVYLLVFGAGTIAGMMVITVMMASALKLAGDRSAWINKRLAIATGFLSVAFGLFIVYQMGIVHGLFTAHPTWTPE